MAIFKNIIKDTFTGLPEPPPSIATVSARTRNFDLELALDTKAKEKGLVAHKPWLTKCNQLYNLASVHYGECSICFTHQVAELSRISLNFNWG